MRITFFLFICLFSGHYLSAQKTSVNSKVGDIMVIKSPASGTSFNHLYFPKKNFIIKKRGIANYKSVYDNRVEITASNQLEDGSTRIYLKRTDGRKFFNFLPKVAANLELALESGELAPYQPKTSGTKE